MGFPVLRSDNPSAAMLRTLERPRRGPDVRPRVAPGLHILRRIPLARLARVDRFELQLKLVSCGELFVE